VLRYPQNLIVTMGRREAAWGGHGAVGEARRRQSAAASAPKGKSNMIDLAAFASLFGEALGATKGWTEPKIARFERLDDAEQETVVRDLKAAGHKLGWVREMRLRQLKREGWKPVFERDAIGRPTIFMDRLKELVLVHRPPPTAA
jgi:hypothetical protein